MAVQCINQLLEMAVVAGVVNGKLSYLAFCILNVRLWYLCQRCNSRPGS